MNFIWKFHAFAKPKCNAFVQMTQSKWLGNINGDYIIINENITLNRCIYLKYYFVLFAGEYEVTGWGEWCNRAFDGRPWEFRKESDRNVIIVVACVTQSSIFDYVVCSTRCIKQCSAKWNTNSKRRIKKHTTWRANRKCYFHLIAIVKVSIIANSSFSQSILWVYRKHFT